MSDNQDKYHDSAGVPWAGRSFQENSYRDDNGEADPELEIALTGFRSGTHSLKDLLFIFSKSRLLIPLVANLGEEGFAASGLKSDKSAELAVITVLAPDGQIALPVFSSVSKMQNWNPKARPVPNNGRAVAFAAASEGTTRVVLDAGSESEIVFRRPQLSAIAQDLDWQPPETNSSVEILVNQFLQDLENVVSFSLSSGDPECRILGQELVITLYLIPGLTDSELQGIERTFFKRLGESEEFVELVDSVAVRFLPSS